MTIGMISAVFEDFNDRLLAPPEYSNKADVPPSADVCGEAWTEGYLTGRRSYCPEIDTRDLTANLVTSMLLMNEKVAATTEAASLAIADLLVLAVTADDWPVRLMERVSIIADRIRPALTGVPEYLLGNENGLLYSFTDPSKFMQTLEASNLCDYVSIHWQRGEVTISRSALLEDLRQAVLPLTCGPSTMQSPRSQT